MSHDLRWRGEPSATTNEAAPDCDTAHVVRIDADQTGQEVRVDRWRHILEKPLALHARGEQDLCHTTGAIALRPGPIQGL